MYQCISIFFNLDQNSTLKTECDRKETVFTSADRKKDEQV